MRHDGTLLLGMAQRILGRTNENEGRRPAHNTLRRKRPERESGEPAGSRRYEQTAHSQEWLCHENPQGLQQTALERPGLQRRNLPAKPKGEKASGLAPQLGQNRPVPGTPHSPDFVKRRKLILWVDFRRGKRRAHLSYKSFAGPEERQKQNRGERGLSYKDTGTAGYGRLHTRLSKSVNAKVTAEG